MKLHRNLTLFSLFELALVVLCQTTSANGEIRTAVVLGDSAGNVSAFDVQSGALVWSVQLGGDTRSVVVSRDGEFVAAGTSTSLAVISRARIICNLSAHTLVREKMRHRMLNMNSWC